MHLSSQRGILNQYKEMNLINIGSGLWHSLTIILPKNIVLNPVLYLSDGLY
ncbi:hypothetical protein HOLleu_36826 [Holothuria leucospilota]|uniref:Uncharacterized protein n=1 Tax=Holothuria leucospilota TaxID=206669 RepID=A0A9Q0YKP3_HOLLE|nr:hypothetical protein HOLleu_36826 [Holothuria leucospilota]